MAVKTSGSEGKSYFDTLVSRAGGAARAPKYSGSNNPQWATPKSGMPTAKSAATTPLAPFSAAIKNSYNPANIFSGSAWTKPAAAPKTEDTSGDGGGYVDPTAAYRAQSAKDRARLEALYNAYAAQIAGNEAGINTNYGASAATLGNIYGGATAATNAGYDAMRAAQTEQLKALGLTGIAPSESFGAQLASAGRYTNLGTASQALNEAQRNAAIAGNQSIVGAVRGEQRGALADFDRMTQENIAAQQQAAAAAAAANAAAQARAQAQSAKDAQYWDYKWADLDQRAKIAADNAARADRELALKYPQ